MKPEDLTDAMARAVVGLMPSAQSLLDGALGSTEPNRNHSRAELARLWESFACKLCTLVYVHSSNHPTGCIFVGWGHGCHPCQACGGSGLSPKGLGMQTMQAAAINARKEKS